MVVLNGYVGRATWGHAAVPLKGDLNQDMISQDSGWGSVRKEHERRGSMNR